MESAYTLFQRGSELLESGNPAQAAHVLERARDLEPEKASIREALGRAYFGFRQFDRAEEQFQKTIALHPTNAFAHFCLGLCYQRLGRLTAALRHAKLAVAMSPELEDYQHLLSRLEHLRADLPDGSASLDSEEVDADLWEDFQKAGGAPLVASRKNVFERLSL